MAGTILVTGATGNIGSKVVAMLSGQGQKVRGTVRSLEKSGTGIISGVEWVEFDLDRPETIANAFHHVEKALIITPFVPEMVAQGKALVAAAKAAGVKHLVRISALGANPNGPVEVGRWHGQVEEAVMQSGIPYTILRPNFFMQNFVNFTAGSIKNAGAFYQPSGDGRVAYIDTRDIAASAVAALTKTGFENQTFDLTGPEAISNSVVADALSRATGRPIQYVDVPEDAARQGMTQSGMPDWMVDAMMDLMAIQKKGWAAAVSPAVKKLTGRDPISFSQFAGDHAEVWK